MVPTLATGNENVARVGHSVWRSRTLLREDSEAAELAGDQKLTLRSGYQVSLIVVVVTVCWPGR